MWSAAVFAPALPGRSAMVSSSEVLSHHTPSGWNPKVCLNVAAAFSFSEWATTIVASTSRTTRSFSRMRSATRAAGGPPARSHTRALVRARALWTRRNLAGVSSSKERHTVGGEATDPNTAS
jgi:hypothetical protein